MEIRDSTVEDIAIIQPMGSVDTRGSFDFERKVKERLAGKFRLFAIDFGKVELLTSAGIRVLVMLAKRLEGIDGRLVLFSLNSQVQTVFEISGLIQHFVIEPSKEAALKRIASDPSAPASSAMSKVSALVMRLLGRGEQETASGHAAASQPRRHERGSELSDHVAQLLTASERHPAAKTPQQGSQVARRPDPNGKRQPR